MGRPHCQGCHRTSVGGVVDVGKLTLEHRGRAEEESGEGEEDMEGCYALKIK